MTRETLSQCLWEHRAAMLRLSYSMLRHAQNAEDAVSAAMVSAYEKAHTLKDDSAVKPWLLTITANICRDQLRKNRRLVTLPDVGEEIPVLFDFDGGDTVYSHLLALGAEMSQTLTLYYYDQLSTREIAGVLGISSAAVRARLARGRRSLRQRLERSGEDEGF